MCKKIGNARECFMKTSVLRKTDSQGTNDNKIVRKALNKRDRIFGKMSGMLISVFSVLLDLVPFGAAALLLFTYNRNHTKQGKGFR